MAKHKEESILVTGATGQLGSAVIAGLLQADASRVIAGTRNPKKISGESGMETRELDFDRPETLRTAFAGVNRALLISTDALGEPGKRIAQHRAAIDAAAAAGVNHLVYTSAPAPMPGKARSGVDDHFWTEAALFSQTAMTWTVLRNELYTDLIVMGVDAAEVSGKLFHATAGRGRAYVTRQNCADAAVGALLEAEENEIFDVTGPAAVTQEQLAQILSTITGKTIVAVDVLPAGLREGMLHAGLPQHVAELLVTFDIAAAQGYHAVVTDAVYQLTRRKPTDVADYLKSAITKK